MPPMVASSPPLSPNLSSDLTLLRSLLHISREISLFESPRSLLQRRNISSVARKSRLLSLIFEELLREQTPNVPRTAALCLKEILDVLRRFKALLENCSARTSRMRLALQLESVSNDFHELTHDLSTLLDIFPLAEFDLGDDLKDLVNLLRNQCRRSTASTDPAEERLRSEILEMIHEIEREIVPERSKLEKMFERLGLDDSRSCRDEIERLEVDIRDMVDRKLLLRRMIALLGLVRYGKCVLFGASTPRSYPGTGNVGSAVSDTVIPVDFRCPISLDLMGDPVVVASGQTYDRKSINCWITSGHATCPKTGQTLANLHLVPNRALKNLISRWCREQNVPFEAAEAAPPVEPDGVSVNKAALEAARMTALFLVQKLAASPSAETANRIVHELRQLAKTGSDNRAFIAEAGAVPLLVPLLGSDDPSLQVNAVTALLNLSILQANKKRIMQAEGALDGVVHVLRSGATWQAKENAAATLLSLSSLHVLYRRKLGRDPRVAEGLVKLVKAGPTSSKRDGLVTMLNLAGDRENIVGLVGGGLVEAALGAIGVADVAEIAVAVLAAVAKRGGAREVGAVMGSIARLVGILRHGTDQARENAAAALVSMCRHGGGTMVAELARTPGIECVIWNMIGSGSVRGRRKAASLGRMYRRWVASQEEDLTVGFDSITIHAMVSTVAQI